MKYLLQDAIADAFAEHASKVAIDQEGRVVTYAQLDRLACRVARALLELKAAAPERLWYVGVSAAVTIESVASILGVLKAGLAYIPLDVQSPPARLRGILEDAGVTVVILDPLAYPEGEELLGLPSLRHAILMGPGEHPLAAAGGAQVRGWSTVLERDGSPVPRSTAVADDLAYVLYTSGSTGVPKGVMLSHRNAKTFVDWMAKEFQIAPSDVVMSRAPLNYDLSVFDVFNSLAAGATLLVKDLRRTVVGGKPGEVRHREYVDLMRDKQATVMYSTPSTFVALMEKGRLDSRVPLRVMMYAGEPFPTPQIRKFMALMPRTRVANIYGPTETNIVTYYWVDEPPPTDDPLPIGREVDDTEIVVVGADGAVCGLGETGELWIRGGTVCAGYLGKPDLTRERLVQGPGYPYPALFWRSGDYGRRREDGNLVYYGRLDSMVKTRGHRVEIGDVEAPLSAFPEVIQAVVVPRKHDKYGCTLHAFVMLKEGARLAAEEVLRRLSAQLPAYMVPADVIFRADYPYTSTGKVDRQQLKRELEARPAGSETHAQNQGVSP